MAAPVSIPPSHPAVNQPPPARLPRGAATPAAAPTQQTRRSQTHSDARSKAPAGDSGFAATLGAKTHAAASPPAQAGKTTAKPPGDTGAAPDGTDKVGTGEELPDADTDSNRAGAIAARTETDQTAITTAETAATWVAIAGDVADMPDDDPTPSASEQQAFGAVKNDCGRCRHRPRDTLADIVRAKRRCCR